MTIPNGPFGSPMPALEKRMTVGSALLGLLLWDHAVGVPVTDGVIVTARPAQGPPQRVQAVRGGAGVYVFQRLPGLAASATAKAGAQPYIVEVTDRLGRFLPVAMQLSLPYPEPGLFQGAGPPGFPAGRLDLYPWPARQPGPGFGLVSGQLWDKARDSPAAFAVLRITTSEGAWYSVADGRGYVTLMFPYPVVRPSLQANPRAGPMLDRQAWTAELSVLYGPAPLSPLPGALVPDQQAILRQPGAQICPSAEREAGTWSVVVQYGQELVLRTDNLSVLHIQPGATAPTGPG